MNKTTLFNRYIPVASLFILGFFIILTGASATFAREKNERFHRILKLYQDPTYFAKDRKITFDFDYSSRSDETEKNKQGLQEGSDNVTNFKRDITNNTALDYERHRGSTHWSYNLLVDAGFNGAYTNKAIYKENSLLQKSDSYDSLYKFASAYTDISFDIMRYFGKRGQNNKRWFFGFAIESDNYLKNTQTQVYREYELTQILSSINKTERDQIQLSGDISTRVGFGRQIPYTPLFKAFQIERVLRKNGVINSDLSDATIIAIAHWLQSEFIHATRHDRPEKFLYETLNALLQKDPSFTPETFDAYDVMHVKETAAIPYQLLIKGTKLYVDIVRLAPVLRCERQMESNLYFEDYDHSINFDYEFYGASLRFYTGLPITDRLFFNLFTTLWYHEGTRGDSYNTNTASSLLTTEWSMGLYYWLNERILFNASLHDLPAYLVIPRSFPSSINLSLIYFIADKVAMNISFEKYYSAKPFLNLFD